MDTIWILCLLVGVLEASSSSHSQVVVARNTCSKFKNQYFPCINNCGCGVCGQHCLPAARDGNPAHGFHCEARNWNTNAPSLACAIHDESMGPLLTALLSTVAVAAVVVLLILFLVLLHHGCTCVLRRNHIDPLDVICDVWPDQEG